MGYFVVSFRIERDSTYQERYDSLRDKVKQIASTHVWDETTSFYAFGAAGDINAVTHALYYGTKLNTGLGDVLLVIDPVNGKYLGHGAKYPTLLAAALGAKQTV
jgi:hypothetical protein